MTEPALGSAIRSNTSGVLAALRRRRLQLDGLDAVSRRLSIAALIGAAVAATLLMLQPLELALPGGFIPIMRTDAPQVGRIALAASLLTLAAALAALAAAAADEHWRWWRPTVAGLGAVGILVTPSVLTTPSVPALPLGLGLIGLVSAVVLIGVGIVGRPRRAIVVAPLAAAPPLAAWLVILAAALPGSPADLESELATSALNGITLIQTPLVAIAVWAVIEYGRGLIAGGRAVLGMPSRYAWLLPLALVAKVAFVAAFRQDWLQIPLRESAVTIVSACAITLAAAWWLLHGTRTTLAAAGVISATWLILVPILIGYLVPLLAFAGRLVPDRLGVATSTGEIQSWMATVDTVQTYALAMTPVLTATLALGGGLALLIAGGVRWKGAAILLLAYAAWTIVPSLAMAFNQLTDAGLDDASGGLLGVIQPVTLDLFITGLVAIMALGWFAGLQRRVPPFTLLAILALSTIYAFATSRALSGLAVLLFWLGFGFPLAAQFLFDAASLNERRADRPAHVLRASGMSSLALGLALPLVALGFVAPGGVGQTEFVKVLFVVPFVAVLFAGTISERPEAVAAGLTEPPESGMPGVGRAAPRYVMVGVVALALIGGGGALTALQRAPTAADPAIQYVAGMAIRIPPEYEMAHSSDPRVDKWVSGEGSGILMLSFPIRGDDEDLLPLHAAANEMVNQLTANDFELVAELEVLALPIGNVVRGRAAGASGSPFTTIAFGDDHSGWVLWIVDFDADAEAQLLESLALAR